MNSKRKGKVNEQAWCQLLKDHGFDAQRTQQHNGILGDADIQSKDLSQYWFEVKSRKKGLAVWTAMDQAISEAKDGRIPVVPYHQNQREWLVIMRVEDWLTLIKQ